MVNDYLSDLVTRVRNGYLANKPSIEAPETKIGWAVLQTLQKENYIAGVERKEGNLVIALKYDGKNPAITGIKRVSKPGARRYYGIKSLPRVLGGLGISILSTPKGVLSSKEAKKLGVGGELIAQIW